jgi:PTS system mannose-specific IIC component
MFSYLALFFISGISSVDRNAALHMMFSRPLVLSTIVGLLFGNVYLCFLSGLLIELFGNIDVPVGTKVSKDDTFMSYTMAVLISFDVVQVLSDYLLALLVVIIFVFPVTYVDVLTRKWNQHLLMRYLKYNLYKSPFSIIWKGIMIAFLKGVVLYNLFCLVTMFIVVQIESYMSIEGNITAYIFLMSSFLAGYLMRFLSFKSIHKYVIFVMGLVLGWLVI